MFANQLGKHRGFKKFISVLVTVVMSITFTFSSIFFPGISSGNFANAKTTDDISANKKPVDHILSKEESKKTLHPTTSYVPGDLLVKLEPGKGVDYAKKLAKKNNDEVVDSISKLGVYRIKTKDEVKNKTKIYKNDAGVKFVEPNYIATASYIPNDPLLNQQWAINKMQATAAWDIERGQSNPVTIAVVDTGVDKDHPDLNDKIVPGYDFINDDNNADDDHGHGTHVAGIAAAETDNNEGIAGVSWHANIMPVKVLDSFGWGTYEGISEGIIFAADNGAQIINLSLGGSSTSVTLESAVNYAHNKGSIVIASAGNSGSSNYNYPASFEKAVSVAATDQNDNRAGFSTYNNKVDIAAPGVNITSSFALNDGGAALAVSADAYSAVYLGFGFEAISTAPDRDATMNNVLQYLDVPTSDAILLVDDDLGESYETYYSQALANLGYGSVSTHEVMTSGPSLEQMTGKTVIWFTGWDYFDTLTDEDQNNLSLFLDNGGKLFLSGQDIGYHLTNGGFIYNAFFENYLKAKFVEDYSGSWDIKGIAGTSFEGMNFQIQGGDGADNQGYPEVLEPASEEAFTIFEYLATGDKYIPLSGTSMAAPQVSGLAALILSKNPSLTPLQVEEILKLNAQDTNSVTYPGKDNYLGWGRINAFEGVKNENQKPYINIVSPLHGQTVTGSININVFTDDSVSGNANISEVTYSVDGAATSPMNPADGAFDSPTENAVISLDTNLMSLGSHTIEVNARDGEGNWGTAIKNTVIVADGLAPQVNITNPSDGQNVGGLINITASVDDSANRNSNITQATYALDGGSPVIMAPSDGSFNSPSENATASLDTTTLFLGAHSIVVKGKDAAGNWGSSTVNFTVLDVTGPKVIIDSFAEDLSQINFDAIISDSESGNSNIEEAAYFIDGGAPTSLVSSDGSYDSKLEFVSFTIDKTLLTNGFHTVNIIGKDVEGNWSDGPSVATYIFAVPPVGEDNMPPNNFNSIYPIHGQRVMQAYPYFSWEPTSDSGSGLAKYQLYIDGRVSRDNLTNWTAAVPSKPVANGIHSWFVRAFDNEGNYTDTEIKEFIVNSSEGKIVFTSWRDGNSEIYIMDSDGTNQIRLTDNPAMDRHPALSPDGSKVVFVSDHDDPNNDDIYVMNIDGSNVVRITDNSETDFQPSWSPDGTKIVFSSSRDGNLEIYLMNSDGTEINRLTNNNAGPWPAEWDKDPVFSPNGRKIIFKTGRDGDFEIYQMNTDGTQQTNLTNNTVFDGEPDVAPDGNMITFYSNRDAGECQIYTMNSDGSKQTRITKDLQYDTDPAFSSDGKKIIFERNNESLFKINLDGSNLLVLTNSGINPDGGPEFGLNLDGEAPSVSISDPMDSQAVSGTISLEAVVDDSSSGNSKIYDAFYKVDDGPLIKMGAIDGKFDTPLETATASLDTTKLNAGNHTLTIKSRDNYGNWGESSISINVIDITGPEITTTNPTNNQDVQGVIDFEAVIDDTESQNSNIQDAEYKIDDGPTAQINSKDGIFDESNEIVQNELDTELLTNGIHTIYIRGRDSADNWSEWYPINIEVNNDAEIIFPVESNKKLSGIVTIKGTAKSANLKFLKYVLQYQKIQSAGGVVVTNLVWATIVTSNQMVNNATLGKWNTAGLDGTYKMRLSVFDTNGNVNLKVKTLMLDNTKPTVTPLFPLPSSVADSAETISAIVSDSYSDIGSATLLLNDIPVDPDYDEQSDYLSYNPMEEDIKLGSNKVTVIAIDSMGNKNSYSYNFVYEPFGPTAEIASPEDTATIGSKTTPVIGSIFSSSLKSWKLEYKKSPATTFTPLSAGTNSTNGNAIIGKLPPLSNGGYKVKLSVTNNALVTNSDQISVTVDAANSYDDFTSISDISIWGNKLVVLGSASSNELAFYKLFLKQVSPVAGADTLIYTGLSPAIESVLANTTIKGNGSYQLILRTYNSLGAEIGSDVYEPLSVDTTAPKITSTYPIANGNYNYSLPITINATDPEPVKGASTKSGLSESAVMLIDGLPAINSLESASYSVLPESMTDGIHNVKTTVTDNVGNSASKTFNFISDSLKPIANIDNPQSNEQIKGIYTIKGHVFDENIFNYQIQYRLDSSSSSWKTAYTGIENVALDPDIRSKDLEEVEDATLFKWGISKLNGKYYVRLIAKDKAGNSAFYPEQSEFDYQQAIPVLIDNKAPTLKTIYPAANSYLTELSSIYISGAYDLNPLKTTLDTTGIDGEQTKLKLNGVENPALYDSETDKINFEIEEPLSDGVYNAEFAVPDNVGNTAIMKTNFTIDSTNPIAELSLVRSSIKMRNKLTIAGKAKDKNIASWTLYQKHSSTSVYTKLASGTGGIGNTVYNSTFYTWAPTKTGAYMLKLEAKDKAGNVSTVTEELTVDNSSGYQDIAEISYPANDQIVKGKVHIVGSASTSSNFAYYTVSRKLSTSSVETLIYKSTTPVEGGKLATFDTTKLNGTYDVVLRRYTNPAAPTEFGSPVSITNIKIDNTLPILSSVSAIPGQTGQPGYVKSNTPTIEIKTKEFGSGIDETKSTVLVDGIPVELDFSETGNASFDNETSAIYVTLPQLEDAKHTLAANIYDKAGNKSKTSTYSFTVDTDDINAPTLPTAQITSPTESATVKGTVPIVGSAFDQNLYNYTLSCKKLGSASFTTFFTSTTNVLDATLGSFKSTSVTDGQYDIKLTVNDKALNVPKESIITVFVDNIL